MVELQAQEVLLAQQNRSMRDDLLARQSGYICRCASRASGRWIDEHDDLYSVALIAFNDAISAYSPDKGSFMAFSNRVIHNRIIDHLKHESRTSNIIPFSTLSSQDEHGKEIPFDIEDKCAGISDVAWEIASITQDLNIFDISFFDLAQCSPKSKRTKKSCREVVNHIINDPELLEHIHKNQTLPVKRILDHVNVSGKILERYRKYIIAGVLICSGEYTTLAGYYYG